METKTQRIDNLTTNIVEIDDSDQPVPEWISNAKGLVYMDDHDGFLDPDAEKINLPNCSIDPSTLSVYQCLKCGNRQSNREEIFRMKCTRCLNKSFNKIRPTKCVKFKAY